ncbi:MAG: iron-containing alcohol dehydrogenase family protein [Fusobacteriaceae bacterium]|jgi:glycerol dehydrogenase|nr:iron-containing alcohol dehydrogenase family protein [Fusobacteriaceae bacterium]
MSKSVFLPAYTIGADAYAKVPEICSKFGKTVVFIGGKTALEKAAGLVKEAIKGSGLEVLDTIWYGGEATYENVEELKKNPVIQKADMVFGFGGGKALDTCKMLTNDLGKPLFNFPTIASTCASVTSVCVVYYPTHEMKELCWRYAPAEHSFINSQVIADAPVKYLWAGIGDTLAKGYEPEFSARGKELDHSNQMGVTLSVLCQEPLVKYGTKGLEDCKKHVVSSDLEEVILTIIVTTGVVSYYVINDYNSCIAHAIFYGFTTIPEIDETHLHGEIVSYGVLVSLMVDNRKDEINKLLPFYKSIDLPVTYKAFDATPEQIETKVLPKAASVNDIKVAAFPVDINVLRKGINDYEAYVASVKL